MLFYIFLYTIAWLAGPPVTFALLFGWKEFDSFVDEEGALPLACLTGPLFIGVLVALCIGGIIVAACTKDGPETPLVRFFCRYGRYLFYPARFLALRTLNKQDKLA